MKKITIIYWVTTIIIFLFEGVMPALTSQTELARQGISNLGYPPYFGVMLTVFKVAGAIALILPAVKGRLKEWAYAGLTFELVSACISNAVVLGIGFPAIMPLIVLGILGISYYTYHRRLAESKPQTSSAKFAI